MYFSIGGMDSAGATEVVKYVGEVRPLGVANFSAETAVTAVESTVATLVEEDRLPGIPKNSATTAAIAFDTTVAKSVDVCEARPPSLSTQQL